MFSMFPVNLENDVMRLLDALAVVRIAYLPSLGINLSAFSTFPFDFRGRNCFTGLVEFALSGAQGLSSVEIDNIDADLLVTSMGIKV